MQNWEFMCKYISFNLYNIRCIIIGSTIAFLGSIALYFSKSLYLTYGLLALFGISFGLCVSHLKISK